MLLMMYSILKMVKTHISWPVFTSCSLSGLSAKSGTILFAHAFPI